MRDHIYLIAEDKAGAPGSQWLVLRRYRDMEKCHILARCAIRKEAEGVCIAIRKADKLDLVELAAGQGYELVRRDTQEKTR